MKQLPNVITCLRIFSSTALLFLQPFSLPFFVVYALCGVSDMVDGAIARTMGTTSKAGAVLDSIADMVFIACVLYVLLPVLPLGTGLLWGIGGVAALRLFSLLAGYVRYGKFAALHTWSNKAAGFLLFSFPFFYTLFGMNQTVYALLVVAAVSALEEAAINLTAPSLNRNVRGIWSKKT